MRNEEARSEGEVAKGLRSICEETPQAQHLRPENLSLEGLAGAKIDNLPE